MNYLNLQNQFRNQKNLSDHPIQTAIRAELIGSDCCSALGMTGRSSAPVLALCRALVTAGQNPNRPLHAYRGDVLCLCVRSIGEGARLTIEDDRYGRPRLRRWRNRARGDGAAPASPPRVRALAWHHPPENSIQRGVPAPAAQQSLQWGAEAMSGPRYPHRKTLGSHLKRPRRDFAQRLTAAEFRDARHRHRKGGR